MTNAPKTRKPAKKVETDESIMPVSPIISVEEVQTATNTPNTNEKDNENIMPETDNTDNTPEEPTPAISPAMAQIALMVRPVRDAQIARIAAIDEEAAKVAGTLAAKVKQAEADISLEADKAAEGFLPDTEAFPALFAFIGEFETLHPICALRVISTILADVEAKRDELLETVKGLVSDNLRKSSAGGDEIASLRTERAELVTSTEAMNVVMGETVILPRAPKLLGGAGTGGTTRNGPKVDKSHGSYYVVETDGTRTFFSNPDLSYIAFVFGVSVVDLKIALGEAGVKSLSSPFEASVTLTAVKKGGRVKPGDISTFGVGMVKSDNSDEKAMTAELVRDAQNDADGSL